MNTINKVLKSLASSILLAISLFCPRVSAGIFSPISTNLYYNAGENTIELAPSTTSASLFSKGNRAEGISLEYEHWQSLTMGTGIELGTYDFKNSPNGIDHLAIMEDYRLVVLPKTFLMNRFALVAKVGATTSFIDGSKSVELGGGINYNLSVKRLRLELDYIQHVKLTPNGNGSTVRFGMQFLF